MTIETEVPQRTIRELHAIVERDRVRFAVMAELWDAMTENDQDAILAVARVLAEDAS